MAECNEQCIIGKKVACRCNQLFCFKHPESHFGVCQYSRMIYIDAKRKHLDDIETKLIDTLDYIYTQIDLVSSNLFEQVRIMKEKLINYTLTINQGYILELNSIGRSDVEEFDPIVVKYNTENLCASFMSKGTVLKLNQNQQMTKTLYQNKVFFGTPNNGRLSGSFEVSSSVLQYIGHLVDGVNHGFGFVNLKNEFRYIGGWFQGKKDGYGVCEWIENNGISKPWYKGNFFNDLMHGYGEYHYSDGSQYLGQWYYGKKHGKGKMIFPDGKIYTGNFENDEVNGLGKKVYPNGETYEGWFKGNLRNGMGKLTKANGRIYSGNFLNNKMIGEFTVEEPKNKVVYQGPIVNEMLNGIGIVRIQNINADRQVRFVNDEVYYN